MKNVTIRHPKTNVPVTLVDDCGHIVFIKDKDIEWSDPAVCRHRNIANKHEAPYAFHIDGFISHVALVAWTLCPDGKFFEDEDGFGGKPCAEETVYAYADENLHILIPFQTMDEDKMRDCFNLAVQKASHLDKIFNSGMKKAPVLFLRSFSVDKQEIETSDYLNAEEHLVPVLKLLGPVVAIADPNRKTQPKNGADRIFVGEQDWHDVVEQLAGLASLVVLQLGLTDGLLWEMERLLSLMQPERVLLVITWSKSFTNVKEVYEKFRKANEERHQLHLPKDLRDGDYIIFDKNWKAKKISSRMNLAGGSRLCAFFSIWSIIKPLGAKLTPRFIFSLVVSAIALLLILAIGIFMVINPLSWLVGSIYGIYRLIRKLFSHTRSKRMQPPV